MKGEKKLVIQRGIPHDPVRLQLWNNLLCFLVIALCFFSLLLYLGGLDLTSDKDLAVTNHLKLEFWAWSSRSKKYHHLLLCPSESKVYPPLWHSEAVRDYIITLGPSETPKHMDIWKIFFRVRQKCPGCPPSAQMQQTRIDTSCFLGNHPNLSRSHFWGTTVLSGLTS